MSYLNKNIIKSLVIVSGLLVLAGCGNITSNKQSAQPDSEVATTHLGKLSQNITAFEKTEFPTDETDRVIELIDNGSVYYLADDGKRYIFPNEETYFSWFKTFKTENLYTLEEIQKIPLGGNVTIRPGSLISTPSDNNIYMIQQGGIIIPVKTEILKKVHGDNFQNKVLQIPNYYFTNYTYGSGIEKVEDYPLTIITLTINQDKGINASQN